MVLISILTIMVLLIMLISEYQRTEIASPLFAFCGIWIIVLSLYSLRLYDIFTIGTDTAWLIFAGLASFVLGYLFVRKIKIAYHAENVTPNWFLLNMICAIIIAISFPYYMSSLRTMLSGGIGPAAYKLLIVTGEADSGNFVIQYIVRPFEYLIMGMSAYVFSKSIKKRFISFSGVYICAIKFFTSGSKAAILYYGIALLLALFNNNEHIDYFKKRSHISGTKKIAIVCVGIAFCASVISAAGDFFKPVYTYLVGCIPLLDQVLHNSFYFNGTYLHGWLSFNGIARFFLNIAELFGVSLAPLGFNQAASIIERFEYTAQIASDIKYNAFTTFLSNFYIDFGFFGTISASFIFGGSVCYIYRRYKQDTSVTRYAQLALIFYMVIFSIVRFQLSHTVIAMAFIYSIILIPLCNIKFTFGGKGRW